jgi:hypothetical protein
MEVAVALANVKKELARELIQVKWTEAQRATIESRRFPASRLLKEVMDAAWYQHTIAHTAWMGAIDELNDLYWHEVSERETQTGDPALTGSGSAFVVQGSATSGRGNRSD